MPHSGRMSSWKKFFSADLQLGLQTSENPCQIFQESFLRQFLSLWLKVKGKPPSSLWVGQGETTAHWQLSTSLGNTLCILGLSSGTCSVADKRRTAAGFTASVLVMLHLQLLASGTCPKTFRPEEQLCLTSSYTSMTQKRSLFKKKKIATQRYRAEGNKVMQGRKKGTDTDFAYWAPILHQALYQVLCAGYTIQSSYPPYGVRTILVCTQHPPAILQIRKLKLIPFSRIQSDLHDFQTHTFNPHATQPSEK